MRPSKKESILGVLVSFLVGIAIVGQLFLSSQLRGGFGIYLLDSNKLVISDEDVISYNKTSHEIKLTAGGVEKVKALALEVPVTGHPFVIKINGKEIYSGSFWVPISSVPHSGIVIVIEIDALTQDNTIKIENGYPSAEFFKGTDPRNDSEVFNYFQNIGKLIE